MVYDPSRNRFDGVGLVHKFCQAWLKAEGLPADMNSLAEDPMLLKDFIAIIRGQHESYEYLIDTDARPRIPWGSGSLVRHTCLGTLRWNESLVRLIGVGTEYGASRLRNGVTIDQASRDVEAEKHISLNASVLEFLDRHPGVIPEGWDVYKRIFFFNSIFEITGWAGKGITTNVVPFLEKERYSTHLRKWSMNKQRIDEWVLDGDAIAVWNRT